MLPGAPVTTESAFLGLFTASWELDIWGRIRRQHEAARAQFLGTEEARRGVLLSLVSNVAQAYFELLQLDAQLDIARRNTASFQDTYDLFQRRLEFGVASTLETSRAEGALGSAAGTIPDFERQIAAKENEISVLLGRNPGPIPRGTSLFEQPVVPAVPAGLPSALLERRPDLRQAEQQLVQANAQVGVAMADFFPQLILSGFGGGVSPQLSGISSVWSLTAGLTGPIFQGGQIRANYQASVAAWEQAKLQYEQAVITAFQEVASALTALAKLAQVEAEQARAVNAYADSVRIANRRYRGGLASYYEVLEAQQLLFPAETQLAQVRANRLVDVCPALQGPRGRLEPLRRAVEPDHRRSARSSEYGCVASFPLRLLPLPIPSDMARAFHFTDPMLLRLDAAQRQITLFVHDEPTRGAPACAPLFLSDNNSLTPPPPSFPQLMYMHITVTYPVRSSPLAPNRSPSLSST